jgi:hypothetical protein
MRLVGTELKTIILEISSVSPLGSTVMMETEETSNMLVFNSTLTRLITQEDLRTFS